MSHHIARSVYVSVWPGQCMSPYGQVSVCLTVWPGQCMSHRMARSMHVSPYGQVSVCLTAWPGQCVSHRKVVVVISWLLNVPAAMCVCVDFKLCMHYLFCLEHESQSSHLTLFFPLLRSQPSKIFNSCE